MNPSKKNMYEILHTFRVDMIADDSLRTFSRVAKMFVNEIFWELKPEAKPN
jgi:hypothetical protein